MKITRLFIRFVSILQDILVFKSKTYGNVLVLDGVIQVTERDEFSYQEMITHLPMFACKNPKKVLIVGGGDGGVLREVVKHAGVEEIHMCEIDRQVCEVGKKFFANTLSTAFGDSRVKLFYDDAARYLREEGKGQNYDVIICDSSDPVGPADVLFKPEFFQSMKDALSPTGVICTQGECVWLHLDFIEGVIANVRSMFSSAKYGFTTIPTYPSGQIGFMLATVDGTLDLSVNSRPIPEDMPLQYYSENVHKAAFVLPGL
jgi:spermidine synthase